MVTGGPMCQSMSPHSYTYGEEGSVENIGRAAETKTGVDTIFHDIHE